MDEVTWEWGKPRNEELDDMQSSPNSGDQIENEMGVVCSTYGDRRVAYNVLVAKPERRRPLGRPELRWDNNIKIDLQEVGSGAWTGFIWLRMGTDDGHL
jgi:hypothetical protein